MSKYSQYLYYLIIAVISIITLLFLPFLGSEVGLGFILPTTWAGWVIFVITKLLVAGINILLFHCFMLQAKINIKDNPNYIAANEILKRYIYKNFTPLSPHQWSTKQYGIKGITIFITSLLSTIALTQAILVFDWVGFLTYLFTIIFGIVFGIIQMKSAEAYWTEEYYSYALYYQEQMSQVDNNTEEILQ